MCNPKGTQEYQATLSSEQVVTKMNMNLIGYVVEHADYFSAEV